MGGKARSLERLAAAGFRVPPFIVISPVTALDTNDIVRRSATLTADVDATFAVRSSAASEDGSIASYAGMLDTFLFVAANDIAARITDVRASCRSERATAYAERHDAASETPSAIVQVMIDADVAGVAFGRDPVDGSDRVVISATYGIGSGVVGGDCTTDTYRVGCDGAIVQDIAVKAEVHRRAATAEGVGLVAVPAARVMTASLEPAHVREIAATVRAIATAFGAPQDVEWAIASGSLYVLQARPVTTPAGIIWDNSNISESYGGIVLPLTYTFARSAYAGAYKQFLRALAIPKQTIAAHEATTEQLLGLVNGRMYYHLLNWYRLLALIPGFRLNRAFMETMMGVSEALPDDTVRMLEQTGAVRDLFALAAMLGALVRRLIGLPRANRRFHALIAATLAAAPDLHAANLDALAAEYARLEACLLTNWQAPLVNDFFAMIFYGILARFTAGIRTDGGTSLHNDLLCAEGGMISTEPARAAARLATVAADDAELRAAFAGGTTERVAAALERRPDVAASIATYIERFGDRCQSELKLESVTLHDDPESLYRAIARLGTHAAPATGAEDGAQRRRAAEAAAYAALRGTPLRSLAFRIVLGQTRARVRDRENLRFERTRVFGHVRRIFLEAGRRLHAAGHLASPRDVFYLEVEQIRSAIRTPDVRSELRTIVAEKRAAYIEYEAAPAPPDRFTSIGNDAPAMLAAPTESGDERCGTGCCPGIVRARVRIVTDPHSPLERGEILVAERTDPGWILLFPAAAGILVERGSVLSHAAIVSREMGIPSVVGLPGLTRWLHDGDLVEFDGRSGAVRRIAAAVACP